MTTIDMDWVAIIRALDGDTTVPLTGPELAHAWQQLEHRDLSAREISLILGVHTRQITRWRAGQQPTWGRRPGGR